MQHQAVAALVESIIGVPGANPVDDNESEDEEVARNAEFPRGSSYAGCRSDVSAKKDFQDRLMRCGKCHLTRYCR